MDKKLAIHDAYVGNSLLLCTSKLKIKVRASGRKLLRQWAERIIIYKQTN